MYKFLLLMLVLIVGCSEQKQSTPNNNNIDSGYNQSVERLFTVYQDDVYLECKHFNKSNCFEYTQRCVARLRQGKGKFSCGDGIDPNWDYFHATHLSQEKILNCIGEGKILEFCQQQFENMHQATQEQIFNRCIKNLDKSFCINGNWKEMKKELNTKACQACNDKCQINDLKCFEACGKTFDCHKVGFHSEKECLKEMIESRCNDLKDRCLNIRNKSNDECITNEQN